MKRDFYQLIFREIYVLHLLRFVDREQTRVIRFGDDVDLPCLRAQHCVLAAVDDLAEVVAALQRFSHLEQLESHHLGIETSYCFCRDSLLQWAEPLFDELVVLRAPIARSALRVVHLRVVLIVVSFFLRHIQVVGFLFVFEV